MISQNCTAKQFGWMGMGGWPATRAKGVWRPMALFIDTFVNRIDKKGRVSVPATFRAALATSNALGQNFNGIVALPAFRYDALQCAGIDWLQNLVEQMGKVDLFSDVHDDLSTTLFSDTKQLAFDGEGRIGLPEMLLDHAKLGDEAAFVGRGEIFEIWHPKTFAEHRAEARRRALEKGMTLRNAGGDNGGNSSGGGAQ
jgi:MraZ protein